MCIRDRHKAYGKTHEYYPAVTKEAYKKDLMKGVMKDYFDSSVMQLVSFFTKEKSLSIKEMDEILDIIEKEKQKNKK
jgi:predicted transcriptional regulator